MTLEQIKAMPAAKVAELITECNKWRKGEPPYNYGWNKPPLTPREFDAILDRAVELLNEQKTTIAQIKLDILHLIDSEYDLAHGSDIRKVLNND